MNSKIVRVNGLEFPVVDVGTGPPVLFLHGFPDSRHLWRHQVDPLVNAGFRVIAPDLRGYGDAPRPPDAADYRVSVIMGDVLGLLDALNLPIVRLAGHDWGAAVAWNLAAYHPSRVERLAALSVGAPGNSGRDSIEQREKSWHMLFFQFEEVAEAWLRKDDWKLLREFVRNQGDIVRSIRDLSRPGALTAALNYYRANLKPQLPDRPAPVFPSVTCPVLGIWSDGDRYLTEAQMRKSDEKVAGTWRYEKISGAGHWMMLEKPDELNRLLLNFLKDTTLQR
ncbi:MAG: alpha/beta fold hydrolase [Candidatus Acidiferrales bacterium]